MLSRTSLFAPSIAWSISEPQSEEETTFLIQLHHPWPLGGSLTLKCYRIKRTEVWFVFSPAIVKSSTSESAWLHSPGNQMWLCPRRNLTQPGSLWKALTTPCQQGGTLGRYEPRPLLSKELFFSPTYPFWDATWLAPILYRNENQSLAAALRAVRNFYKGRETCMEASSSS